MLQVPRGAPFVDLLVPIGSSAGVSDLQTRLELAGGAGWRLLVDDGSMETSMVPSQPLRGSLERVWAVRHSPVHPSEPMDEAVGIGVELALSMGAHLTSVGVYGVVGWALILFDQPRWLYGLTLLEWLYNPRLSLDGTVLEGDDPKVLEQAFRDKARRFPRLFTAEATTRFEGRVPKEALQEVEGLQALNMLGPGGAFDPRYWQSFAVQMALAEVQAFAAAQAALAPGAIVASPEGLTGSAPLKPAVPATPPGPDDGLSPLQRARRDAALRAAKAAITDAEPPPPEVVDETPESMRVRWLDLDGTVLLYVPSGRFDDAMIRSLQAGSDGVLSPGERPSADAFSRWTQAGAAFVTEVPFLSRLFWENSPVHAGVLAQHGAPAGDLTVLPCHLPRVGPVIAIVAPRDGGRRIVVTSRRDLEPGRLLVALAPV